MVTIKYIAFIVIVQCIFYVILFSSRSTSDIYKQIYDTLMITSHAGEQQPKQHNTVRSFTVYKVVGFFLFAQQRPLLIQIQKYNQISLERRKLTAMAHQ